MSGYRILAIHAHPDDEASKGAATLAKYAAEGHEVRVLTCTGGERGSILNPSFEYPEGVTDLKELRRVEMREAAAALGVSHRWLGYVDSGFPDAEAHEDFPVDAFARHEINSVAARVVGEIREFRPHVIITYDEHGGYPHPDHLMVHAASMLAWLHAGKKHYYPELGEPWEPLKVYYAHGFPIEKLRRYSQECEKLKKYNPFEPLLEDWDLDARDMSHRVTTQVNCAKYFPQRAAALRAHATQIDPDGPFLVVDPAREAELWPTEEFELAATRVPVSLPETDLLAGLEAKPQTGVEG